MKAEVIRGIAFNEANAWADKLTIDRSDSVVRSQAAGVQHHLTEALRILEQAGFVVLPKEELEAALKGMLRHAPLIPDHFTDTTFVDVPATAKSVRRAAALLAAITQEKSDGL